MFSQIELASNLSDDFADSSRRRVRS